MAVKILSDAEIIAGLRHSGMRRSTFEDGLYLQFAYFIEEGKKKFTLTQDDAFSCYSDSVIQVIDNIINNSFEGRSSIKTYLYQIFHNKCVDQVRKNTTKKGEVHQAVSLSDMLYSISDTAKTIIQELVARVDIEELRHKLKELGDNCRQMLLLSAEGYPDKEIAVAMNFKSAAVAKTSRLRCLEKLRMLYKIKK